jgi:hypothetical protein
MEGAAAIVLWRVFLFSYSGKTGNGRTGLRVFAILPVCAGKVDRVKTGLGQKDLTNKLKSTGTVLLSPLRITPDINLLPLRGYGIRTRQQVPHGLTIVP